MYYRPATFQDYQSIAQLHARSWQENYRGIWSDEYLDGGVMQDRLTIWQQRLQEPADNQYIIVAEENGVICGFACIFINDDPTWGTLLDNLHVSSERKGQGIGKKIMQAIATYLHSQNSEATLYLWVLAKNYPAIKFYEAMKGSKQEQILHHNPDGGVSEVIRYVWRDLNVFF